MRSPHADGQARLHSWRHVREFAVPASMITIATTRRLAGDWAGACAAAHVDVDLDPRAEARTRGQAFAALLRADLRRLAPDLLRWHLPRTITDGRLRPGLTMTLARYPDGTHLVARTAPNWADAGQRISLALWDPASDHTGPHPWPRPDRRFRLDLHPHLWAADRAADLYERSGAAHWRPHPPADGMAVIPAGRGHAAHRWAAEADILRAADGFSGPVAVRLGGRRRLMVGGEGCGPRFFSPRGGTGEPVLPYAATWLPPDLELLHAGLISADRLHPLVARALLPAPAPNAPPDELQLGDLGLGGPGLSGPRLGGPGLGGPGLDGPRLVECRGEIHRLAIVDGRLVPLDHGAEQLRREELLVVFGGPPLPCLQVIAAEADSPDWLDDVRARLCHGDRDGARELVTARLGPGAPIEGALRRAFDEAAAGVVEHGLYRSGLSGRTPAHVTEPVRTTPRRRRRSH